MDKTYSISSPIATFIWAVMLISFAGAGTAWSQDSGARAPQTAPVPTESYTLEELLRLATANAAVIDEHKAKIRRAEWQSFRARRAWTPKIEANSLLAPVPANADPSRFDENIDEILSLSIGPYFRQTARVIVPIYTFGRMSTAKELAEIGIDVAVLQAEQARMDHFFQIKRAYYGLQLSNEFRALLEEGDEMVKDALEEMEEARDFGEDDFNISDLRKLQIFNAEIDTLILDNTRLNDLTLAALRYLTGVEGEFRVPRLQVNAEPAQLLSLEHYMALGMEHRPEMNQLRKAVEARGLQQRLERRNFYPNIFIAADFGFGWSTEDVAFQRVCRRETENAPCRDVENLFTRPYSNPFQTLSFGVALGLNWSFDFSQAYGRLQEARAQGDEVLAQRERATGAMRLEITNLYREAADARAKIGIQRRRFEAARRWRDQFGLTLQIARGDTSDAIDPLRAFYDARRLYLEAHHNYLVARAALAQGIGLDTLEEHSTAPVQP